MYKNLEAEIVRKSLYITYKELKRGKNCPERTMALGVYILLIKN